MGLDFDDEELGTASAGTTMASLVLQLPNDPSAPPATTTPLNVCHDTPVASTKTIPPPPPMLHPTKSNEKTENATLSHTQLLDLFQFSNDDSTESPPGTTSEMTTTTTATTNDPTTPLAVLRESDVIGIGDTAPAHHQSVEATTTIQEAFIDEFKLPSDDEDES